MLLFLDSALLDEVRYALDMWDLDGVTTNPRHVATSGRPLLRVVQEIGELFKGTDKTVSVQTNPHHHNDAKAIVEEARKFAKLCPNFVIKMPCTENGFKACRILAQEQIRCNLTLCFSAAQALQAMRAGAFYVSPFVSWKEANGEETRGFIEDCVDIRDNGGYQTKILAAAMRNGRHLIDAAAAGADIATAGLSVWKESMEHPYTDQGLALFQGFWDKTPYEG